MTTDPTKTLSPAGSPFHVLAKPIGPKCNLRCEYCFYLEKEALFPDHETAASYRMSDETLEEFTRQYIACQHPQAMEINFAWQGGEPTLMGIDFYKKALAFQEKYKRQGMKITNSLQTNGTLLDDEWGRFLKENGFLVGLSIDGPEKLHDKWRLDAAGKGTFAQVMKGLEALKRHEVEFNTLTVVQRSNGDHPQEVYRFLKEIGSTYLQFIPIVEPEGNGAVSYRSVKPRQWGKFMIGIFDEWRKQDVGEVFVQQFDMLLGILMGYPSSICVHSPTCGRAVVIEHNGDLFSCDHFVYDSTRLGNISETSLTAMIDSPEQMKFGRDKYDTLPRQCKECKVVRFCYGGCPSDRVRKDKYGEPGLNNQCEGYRNLVEYTLPYLQAMGEAIRRQQPASEYRAFLPPELGGTAPQGGAEAPPAAFREGGAAAEESIGKTAGKIGRNNPCPCGSGKKYKNCHGRS